MFLWNAGAAIFELRVATLVIGKLGATIQSACEFRAAS